MNINEATLRPPEVDEEEVDVKVNAAAQKTSIEDQKEILTDFLKDQISAYNFHLEVNQVNRTNLPGEETSKPVLKLSLQAKQMATVTERKNNLKKIYDEFSDHGWDFFRITDNVEDVDGIFESNNLIDSIIIFKKQTEDQSSDSST